MTLIYLTVDTVVNKFQIAIMIANMAQCKWVSYIICWEMADSKRQIHAQS